MVKVPISFHISIHAPAKGATFPAYGKFYPSFISIHAPAKGATSSNSPAGSGPGKFQSTHPRRVRLELDIAAFHAAVFQSTHPRRVRPRCPVMPPQRENISIHAPAKGATIRHAAGLLLRTGFQSTHPRRVRLFPSGSMRFRRSEFQSTHPRRVRRSSNS